MQCPILTSLHELQESACGCAGVFSAPVAMALYAEAFSKANALDKLEGFASIHGPKFYGLPVNHTKMHLTEEHWQVPDSYQFGSDVVVPMRAGQSVAWKVAVENDS